MKKRIQVNLGTDHAFECIDKVIGRAGEGLTTRLEITVPEALQSYEAYIDFEKPNGETLKTSALEVEGGVAYYDVSQYLLSESGEIKVQIVFQKSSGEVWKSSKKRFTILKSINAESDIPDKEDFITEAQKVLDELSGEVNEIAEKLMNDTEFVETVRNSIQEATSVKTVTGSRLRFFVGTRAEYEALLDKENLFALFTDDDAIDRVVSKQEFEDYQLEVALYLGTEYNRVNDEFKAIKEAHETKQDKLQEEVERNSYNFDVLFNNIVRPTVEISISASKGPLKKDDAVKLKNSLCLVIFQTDSDIYSGMIGIDGNIDVDSHGSYYIGSVGALALRIDRYYSDETNNVYLSGIGDGYSAGSGTLKFYKICSIGEKRDVDSFELKIDTETITYQYEKGMVWEEWIYSKYNDGRIYLYNQQVCYRTLADDRRTGDITVAQGTNEEGLVNPQTADMKIGVSPNSYVVVPTEYSGIEGEGE